MQTSWKNILPSALVILFLVFAYSIIRYNVIKGVELIHLALFINNKAISLGAVVFIGLSYALGPLSRFVPKITESTLSLRKYFGLAGFGLASIHALISLLIFSPAYYSKFFADGKLNLVGELSMLFGVLALFVFSIVALSSLPSIAQKLDKDNWLSIQRFGYFAYILVMLHVFTMGIQGWLTPSHWPGGLLPISLVAFIVITFVLLIKLASIFTTKN